MDASDISDGEIHVHASAAQQDDPVPLYTATEEEGLRDWLRNNGYDLKLPLLHFPETPRDGAGWAAFQAESDIITAFHKAVRTQNTEAVCTMIQQGLVSPDVTNASGATPLIAAVEAGNATMVRTLLGLGAELERYGGFAQDRDQRQRTPLQVAAAKGNLVVVKLLMEEFGADDALIAPDGQLALRLAAEGGHREVVDYLPLRRGGGFRRWKVHHEIAIRRATRAAAKIGYAFKLLFWSIPKYLIVLPVRDGTKWVWKNRKRFGSWCKRQVTEFPGRVKKAGKHAWDALKKTPQVAKEAAAALWKSIKAMPGEIKTMLVWIWGVIKKVPGAVKKIIQWVWGVIKAVPGVLKTIALWVWGLVRAVGEAAGKVVGRVVSFLHTILSAVVTFFRNLTFLDIWNGICDILSVIFIDVPKAVWAFLKEFGDVSYRVLAALLGGLGKAIWYILLILLWLVLFIPHKFVEILANLGSSFLQAIHEVFVWINPKAA